MKENKRENGQILVILVVAVTAIFAFTALAIDGSLIYNERRTDQSTADSAALAGAGAAAQYLKANMAGSFSCGSTDGDLGYEARKAAILAAVANASEGGTTLANNIDDKNGVITTCNDTASPKYIEIQVMTSSVVETNFLQVVSKEVMNTTTESVARVYVSSSFAGGNALVALGQTCDASGGIYALGNGQVRITGGGAYSGSCIQATGSSKIFAYEGVIQYTGAGNLLTAASAPVLILNDTDPTTEPNISESLAPQVEWYGPNTAIDESLLPEQATQTLTPSDIDVMTAITAPTCGAAQTTTSPLGSGATIQPGTYSSLSWGSWGSGSLTLSPGVYCFDGAVNLSGGAANVVMDNTTLYFRSGATLSSAFSGNNLSYSMNGSTIYVTSGDLIFNRPITANNSKVYIDSGSFTINGSASVTMDNSSIYLKNGTFNVTAGGTLSANNITIYIKQGNFVIDGGAIVEMHAPSCSTSACGVGPAIPGVLLYMDKTNTGTFTIDNGTGTAHVLEGTCYCPNALATIAGGTSTTTTNVQLIAKRISVNNGAVLNMNLNDATLYSQGSTIIELTK